MFLRMAADSPLAGEELSLVAMPDIMVEALMSQKQTSSPSGLLPLVTLCSSTTGSKKVTQAGATMENECVPTSDGPPDSLPLVPSAKPQAIKKGKKVQVIHNDSRANYMVSKQVFGYLVSTKRDPASRCVSGSPPPREHCRPFSINGSAFFRTMGVGTGVPSLTSFRLCTGTSLTRRPGRRRQGRRTFGFTPYFSLSRSI